MSYIDETLQKVITENPNQPEYHQAVKEVLESLRPAIERNEAEYRREARRYLRQCTYTAPS